MDIFRSFKRAKELYSNKNQNEIADDLKMTPQYLSTLIRRESLGADWIKVFADYFGIKVSEFIALGEASYKA